LVLDALVERELMRQAAVVYGISITPEKVDEKIDELRQSASENGNFDAWLQTNQWTLDEFREALGTEMMVEEVVVTVTADVPYAVEQVRARYIQVDDPNEADSILNQYREGSDFGALAERYSLDQATAPYGGDLGFFARGSLLVPEVETAAFDLQLDEVSDVLALTDPQSGQTTYYVIQLIERESSRPLSANLRYKLLQEAYDQWMEELKASATIIQFGEGQ
jgi:parvulin-like peptidyl-prolyl isomerase